MRISITGPDVVSSKRLQLAIEERLERAFQRVSHRIDRVDVAVTDENGPRGGVDKQCRIRVYMPGFEPFVATAKGEHRWAAISRAVIRARRKVMTNLKRPQSVRERLRRQHGNDTAAIA